MNIRQKTIELDAAALKTAGNDGASLGEGIIARFDAVVTTNKEDRDHDVMEPSGAVIDTKMPLLWQHDAGSPIGRYVETIQRDSEKVAARYEIADTPLGRDAVKLLKLGVLRLSHGFRPLEFEQRKGTTGGYHIKRFEIVETSLVSIPSNPDAEVLALETKSFESQPAKTLVEFLKGNSMTTTTQTPPAETKAGTIDTDAIKTAVKEGMTEAFAALTKGNGDGAATGEKRPTPADLLNAAKGGTDVRVKSAADKYSRETRALKHFKTGEAVRDPNGREPQSVSELSNAKAGAFLKSLAVKAGLPVALDDEDRALMELCYGEKWCGHVGNEYVPELDGTRAKALLNDSVSGGSSAVPYFFDADLISFPLLTGELFPYVDVRNVPRGSSVHGASVANPTVAWNQVEGTEISLFDTASLIAALNTSIYNVAVAIEVGRDFLADSPADVGRILTENVGQKLASELDKVVAVGDGTSQPCGIFTASGTVTVHSDNNTTGPMTLNDVSSLLFGIGKQYRNAAMRPCFVSNDVTYQRSRALRVDPHVIGTTVNQSPLFGMDSFNAYSALGWPWRINNSIGNSDISFAAMARFRMYRRLGFELRWVTEGADLARRNTALLIARGRFGGQPVDGNAFAVMTDAQS